MVAPIASAFGALESHGNQELLEPEVVLQPTVLKPMEVTMAKRTSRDLLHMELTSWNAFENYETTSRNGLVSLSLHRTIQGDSFRIFGITDIDFMMLAINYGVAPPPDPEDCEPEFGLDKPLNAGKRGSGILFIKAREIAF